MRRSIALVLAWAVLSCSDPTSVKSDVLRINVLPDALELINLSDSKVYFYAFEKNFLATVDLAPPCRDPVTCEGVDSGVKYLLPYTNINGYVQGSSEAVVYHWHLIPDGANGFRPDSLRATEVHLHI